MLLQFSVVTENTLNTKMTSELLIINSAKPCLVNSEHEKYFKNKILFLDDNGVYYTKNGKKYYIHDQVYLICVKEGKKPKPTPKSKYERWLQNNCDPR
jgi:hypothetical protein